MKHVEPTLFSKKVSSSPVDSAEYDHRHGGFFCLSQVGEHVRLVQKDDLLEVALEDRPRAPAVWPS